MADTTKRLRIRLETLARMTDGACTEALGVWVGDAATDERQAKDDSTSRRLHWQEAHLQVLAGMKALGAGDIERAEHHCWIATSFVLDVLWHCVRESDKAALGQRAKKRGRPRKPAK